MLLQYFYDKSLAHASYLVGCQRSGEALVIDPGRHVEPYLEAASAAGLKIVGTAETHIHADFVSGARELADRVGARLYLSDEGPTEWRYQYAREVDAQLLRDGDVFRIGGVKLQVMHTPGHTPESISLVLTDEGGGATSPMGIFTGDFVFVGSIGRPDLLETAAGVVGSAESGARQLYHSMRRFRDLPGHWQVWPAHGAGSACGKGLGAIPSSTVGYEKLFNPALQFDDEQAFVDYILADQPETPPYFAVMKRVNKMGPQLLNSLRAVRSLSPASLPEAAREQWVIDIRTAAEFAAAHVPQTINIPIDSLVRWAGFLVDYERAVYLLASASAAEEAVRRLRSIGIDSIGGHFDVDAARASGQLRESYRSKTPEQLRDAIETETVELLDVRSATEFQAGHIPQAQHYFVGRLPQSLSQLDRGRPLVVQCQQGGRSAIAASLLQRAGLEVTNMQGGYQAWVDADLPTVQGASVEMLPSCKGVEQCQV